MHITNTRTYVHTYITIQIHTCTHAYVRTHLYTNIQVHVPIHTYVGGQTYRTYIIAHTTHIVDVKRTYFDLHNYFTYTNSIKHVLELSTMLSNGLLETSVTCTTARIGHGASVLTCFV